MSPLSWIAAAGVWASAIFDLGGAILLRRWSRTPISTEYGSDSPETPPLTMMRPIKPGVRDLTAILAHALSILEPQDQLLIGVPAGTEVSRQVREFSSRCADSRVQVMDCVESEVANPKVAKLMQMAPFARHSLWCFVDAEARLHRQFLEVCRTRCDGRTLLTATYYYAGDDATLWDRLDQAGFYGFFWPGVAWARCGAADFAFGACIAIRKDFLVRLGGFPFFSDRLAEDYWLGKKAIEADGAVFQVPIPASLTPDRMTAQHWWKTLRRRMTTYRTCRPESFAGTVATQGPAWALLLVALAPQTAWRWGMLATALGIRTSTTLANRKSISGNRCILRPWEAPMFILAASVLETVAWGLSWISPRIEWSGRKLRIGGDGRIQ